MTENKVVKITKRDNINSLLKREDLTENEKKYLIHELELLDKKNAYKAEKNAEKNADNEILKTHILNVIMDSNGGITTSAIAVKVSELVNKNVTAQKVRPLITSLMNEELVENYKEKGVSLFRSVG